MADTLNDAADKPTTFSALLNYLFATKFKPDGERYSAAEVSKATGLREEYISNLRKGKIANPPAGRVQAIADFFGVNVGYFTGKFASPQAADMTQLDAPQDQELWDALRKPLVREVALRAGAMGSAERAIILEMLDRAEQLAKAAEATNATRTQGDNPDESTTP
jgi:transcriptional regulator with XRE-family HTH domain